MTQPTERPTGTVTFLFTDIEGSTQSWDRHGEAMAQALARHDALLRNTIAAHHGWVFSTGGDGFAVAFNRASDAVAAAVAAQRALQAEPWPEPLTIRVRMGLHTGEAEERDGDYFGRTLNRAARIMGLGAGGQVLMSAATKTLVDVGCRSEGLHELRGMSRRTEVFTVLADGLGPPPPPLRSGKAPTAHIFLTAVTGAIAAFPPLELLFQLRDFMVDWRRANDRTRLSRALLYCAYGLHDLGDSDLAARLLGGLTWVQPVDHGVRDGLVERLQAALTPEVYATSEQLGRDTPITVLADEAIEAIGRLELH